MGRCCPAWPSLTASGSARADTRTRKHTCMHAPEARVTASCRRAANLAATTSRSPWAEQSASRTAGQASLSGKSFPSTKALWIDAAQGRCVGPLQRHNSYSARSNRSATPSRPHLWRRARRRPAAPRPAAAPRPSGARAARRWRGGSSPRAPAPRAPPPRRAGAPPAPGWPPARRRGGPSGPAGAIARTHHHREHGRWAPSAGHATKA